MKKALVWMMVFVMCASLLTGCGGTQKEQASAASDPVPESTAPSTQTPDNAVETAAQSMATVSDFWSGYWYGWWCLTDAAGLFAPLNKYGYDAYAQIEVNDDGTGAITVWDMSTAKENPLVFGTGVTFETDTAETGCLVSDGYTFFQGGKWNGKTGMVTMENSEDGWEIDPADSTVSRFEKMIEIDGEYVSPENAEDRFAYHIYLRPWGISWEDVSVGDTTGCIAKNMMPICYDDWYLPLLALGYTAAPPATYEEGKTIVEQGASTTTPTESPTTTPPTTTPAAPANEPLSVSGSEKIQDFMTHIETTIHYAIPASGWVVQSTRTKLYLYNVPTANDAFSDSPRIQFETTDEAETMASRKNPEKLKEIGTRSIGGLDMKGYTYTLYGMDWTEYNAEMPGGIWMVVKTSSVSTEAGTTGSNILESISFE